MCIRDRHNHVPWTRRLVAEAAGDPACVSRDYAEEHRDQLALKPAHDYGGHGVHLGWEADARAWSSVLDECLGGEYVVQRRISAHRERFPVDEPGFPLHPFYLDTDAYTFRGRMGGVLTRLSVNGITNVSQSGSMVPSFLVSPA